MPTFDDTGPGVDPILLKVLDAVPFRLSADGDIKAARQQLRDLPRRPLHPELRVQDRAIDGPAGQINIRIYWPPTNSDDGAAPPVVLYFHGGGFVVGDLDTHDGTCRQHAVGASAVVVSVEYRLAPEHPYPAAIEDAWAATQWVALHGAETAADVARLAVAGDSAGGTISAVIAQRARDSGGPPILFQLLWYPATLWDASLPSFSENASAPILDRAAVAAFSRWYAGDVDLSDPRRGWRQGGRRTWPACRLPTSPSPAMTRCVTTGCATENCWPLQVFPSRYTTPRRWCTATSAMPVWCRPPQPRWSAG
jgi:acetyl esterase/lipase